MKIFLNGDILPQDQAVISVFDHGFLYGYGLFETLRAYNGQLFLWEEHFNRLRSSAEFFQIEMNKTLIELQNDIYQTLEANDLDNAYIRITLSGGTGHLGLIGGQHQKPTWVIMVKPVGDLPPVKSIVLLNVKRSTPEGYMRTKSLAFANNMLAKKELFARDEPTAEGIFLNDAGHLVEGVVSNLFFVRDGHLFTPEESTGLLSGVTRKFILKLCSQIGVQAEEGCYSPEELMSADEVFLTNSIQEIVPVNRRNGLPIENVPGPVTELLMKQYQQAIVKGSGRR